MNKLDLGHARGSYGALEIRHCRSNISLAEDVGTMLCTISTLLRMWIPDSVHFIVELEDE